MTATDDLVTTDPTVAIDRLRSGGLVVLPTETVYGLAADAADPDAVARIFDIKGRPRTHPLIVHVARPAGLADWAGAIPDSAARLAAACWPGPLTVIVERSPRVHDVVTAGLGSVGVRVPAHPLTEIVLREFRGLAAPSANRFGAVSPTTAGHVVEDLGGVLIPGRDVILDGGPCPVGVESTIVDCTVDPPQVLRPGGIATEDIERLLEGRVAPGSGPSRASGMLDSHYAPNSRVVLAESAADERTAVDMARSAGEVVEVIDLTDDLVAYARDLYSLLRAADRRGADTVVARLPPARGLGHAIRDRLTKAAGPRPGPDRPSRAR